MISFILSVVSIIVFRVFIIVYIVSFIVSSVSIMLSLVARIFLIDSYFGAGIGLWTDESIKFGQINEIICANEKQLAKDLAEKSYLKKVKPLVEKQIQERYQGVVEYIGRNK